MDWKKWLKIAWEVIKYAVALILGALGASCAGMETVVF